MRIHFPLYSYRSVLIGNIDRFPPMLPNKFANRSFFQLFGFFVTKHHGGIFPTFEGPSRRVPPLRSLEIPEIQKSTV
ncbi:hypothetical protein HanPSC8_Chr09g0358791 [Helianthus annuus]|nr:hypothetical protein HanPSC8_Chr09g0358791 [Helianthus annuus]